MRMAIQLSTVNANRRGWTSVACLCFLAFTFSQAYQSVAFADERECKSILKEMHWCRPYNFAFSDKTAIFAPATDQRLVKYIYCGDALDSVLLSDAISLTNFYAFKREALTSCEPNYPRLSIFDRRDESIKIDNGSKSVVFRSHYCKIDRYIGAFGGSIIHASYDEKHKVRSKLCQVRAFSIFVGLPLLTDVLFPELDQVTDDDLRVAPGTIQSALFLFLGSNERLRGGRISFQDLIETTPWQLACQMIEHKEDNCRESN